LQLLTRPKKKLNLLKRLPNDEKYNPKGRLGKEQLMFSKDHIKLNSTGMNNMKSANDSTLSVKTAARTTTAQSQSTAARVGTTKGRTRKDIISAFFISQNWRYMAKKALMIRHEREQAKESIVKYRRFKLGLRKFWKVYKVWIAKVKLERQNQQELEQSQLETEHLDEPDNQEIEEEKVEMPETPPKRLFDSQDEKDKKTEFILSEDNDIFSVNEGLDLNKFKESQKNNTHEYDSNLQKAKDSASTKCPKNLEIIQEDPDESVILSPFHMKVGKVLSIKLEKAWEKRCERKEGKRLRELLKNLPPQCRTSYVKLMQLRGEAAGFQTHTTRPPF
jgi:hypothetical protein